MSHFDDARNRSRVIAAMSLMTGGALEHLANLAELGAEPAALRADTTYRPTSTCTDTGCRRPGCSDASVCEAPGEICEYCDGRDVSTPDEIADHAEFVASLHVPQPEVTGVAAILGAIPESDEAP